MFNDRPKSMGILKYQYILLGDVVFGERVYVYLFVFINI